MFERPCEVLIRRNAEIEWAECKIKEKSEELKNYYNSLIAHGVDPRIARAEYIETMKKVCNHFMPSYRRAAPNVTFTLSLEPS